MRNVAALQAELEAALAARPVADWLARLEAAGIPCGPIQDVAAVLADPQIAARNMLIRAGARRDGRQPHQARRLPRPPERPPPPPSTNTAPPSSRS